MSNYEWISIDTSADYQRLEALLEADFQPKVVVEKLQNSITDAVKGILIEYGYVDKDYRSTYYHFYAKKGRRYRDDCVRLHLFDATVSFDPKGLNLNGPDSSLGDHYFGYVVLRPTMTATIGRSILSPDVRTGARGSAIQSDHVVHVLGHTLKVWGFPSMAQHADISVCAHVSCWAILRHYSERYASHRELLIHDITMMAHPFDPGGLTPALGLNVAQAERIFQAAGSYPLIVSKKFKKDDDTYVDHAFFVQMLAYLESGFPLFVAMYGQEHAIVAIGHEWRPTPPPSAQATTHVWQWVDSISAVDDNRLPYERVPVQADGIHRYSANDFDSFIVSLPDKIFYPADAVERQSEAMLPLVEAYLSPKPDGAMLRRYFIMTLSGLRKYARENQSQLGTTLVSEIMRMSSARFIWIVEYATVEQWASGHIHARAILDATASPNDAVPVWHIHNEQQLIVFDRSTAASGAGIIDLNRPDGAQISRIEQNLRPIKNNS